MQDPIIDPTHAIFRNTSIFNLLPIPAPRVIVQCTKCRTWRQSIEEYVSCVMDVRDRLRNLLKKRAADRNPESNKEEPPPKQKKQSNHDKEIE